MSSLISKLGPDYINRAGPASRTASVCRGDFQPGTTWGESARLMADAWSMETGASLILYGSLA